MKIANRIVAVVGLGIASAALGACDGEVRVETPDPLDLAGACAGEAGSVLVRLPALEGLAEEEVALDVDVCVGAVCGQALVDVVETAGGSVPDGCIVSGTSVGCCFGSPEEAVLACAADPAGAAAVQLAVPAGTTPGTTLAVDVRVRTVLGVEVTARAGSVTLAQTEGCETNGVYGVVEL
ncbi:MAG: hypothetical protein IT373_27790 [Polyangiaceae bacterium]|nr:hypothetical protein [Polyangiaceae bacterium]